MAGRWEPLPDFPYASYDGLILPISETEILLGMGDVPGNSAERRTFVFDTVTKTYANVGELPTEAGASARGIRCGLAEGSNIALCLGELNGKFTKWY